MPTHRDPKPKPTPAAPPTEHLVRLRVVCKAPPKPEDYDAEFGLQDNSSTTDWRLHPGAVQANGDHHFEFGLRVRRNPATGSPNFLGDFVHGGAAQRFVYLSWRARHCRAVPPDAAPAGAVWQRRMKIHLATITWPQVEEVVERQGVLEVAVDGTARDGGPNCASVKLLGNGWTVRFLPHHGLREKLPRPERAHAENRAAL
jgi:hypothetical protein